MTLTWFLYEGSLIIPISVFRVSLKPVELLSGGWPFEDKLNSLMWYFFLGISATVLFLLCSSVVPRREFYGCLKYFFKAWIWNGIFLYCFRSVCFCSPLLMSKRLSGPTWWLFCAVINGLALMRRGPCMLFVRLFSRSQYRVL